MKKTKLSILLSITSQIIAMNQSKEPCINIYVNDKKLEEGYIDKTIKEKILELFESQEKYKQAEENYLKRIDTLKQEQQTKTIQK